MPVAAALFLLSTNPAFAQQAASAPTTNAGQIKKNILNSKKGLAAVEKKLKEEKKKQRQAQIKERSVLNRLQKVDKALGRLKREKEANEADLGETRARLDRLQGD
ncbi:MAG TPA: hypothetical protein VIJ93_13790, partial [bacterium]